MMNPNFMQAIQLLKTGGNPQEMVMNMLQGSGNPMANNITNLMQAGNGQGLEQIARNMCESQGKDFDKEFNSFKQMFGL